MTVMLEVKNLSKNFGQTKAVDDISFKAGKGEVVGFLGPNGAGKSTTMKMISGYLFPTAGEIYVQEMDVLDSGQAAKRIIGYLPEGAPAYSDMTVISYLNFIAEIRGLQGLYRRQQVNKIVKLVHLEEVLEQRIETLSKGFKRRVGLAQAMVHDPKILILDEPTDGLDPNQKHEVRKLINNIAKDKVIILSTHILEEVEAVCDRVIVIAEGKIVADSTVRELSQKSPLHNAVIINIRNTRRSSIEDVLNSLAGVSKVDTLMQDNNVHVTVYPNKSGIKLIELSQVIVSNSWDIASINTKQGQLDEVFRSITQQPQQAD